MPRPSISKEQKIREGLILESAMKEAQLIDDSITQESLALELDMSQGNFNHWLKGRSHIPDKHLVWLGNRLNFDVVAMRPSLLDYKLGSMSHHEKMLIHAYQQDPALRRSVDSIAVMSPFYTSIARLIDKPAHDPES